MLRSQTPAPLALLAVGLVAATGCAGSGVAHFGEALPGSRLSEMRRFYVQHRPEDDRDIHLEIQRELEDWGLEADAGPGPPPPGTEAVVSYVDRHVLDQTPYCLQLTIYVRDLATGYITATGWSRRAAMHRKTARGHARLILGDLLGEPSR